MEVQKIAEVQYSSLYRVEKMLFEAKLKLRNKMLEWMQENLGIVLDSEEEFINLAIQNWLDDYINTSSKNKE